jgi:hypothetical protein
MMSPHGFFPHVLVLGNQVPHLGSPSAIQLYSLFLDWPADRLLAIGPDYHPYATRLACRYETWTDPWERLERTRFSRWVRTFRVAANLSAFDEHQLFMKLGEFRPDIVVSLMEFQRFYAGAWRFAQVARKPFVLLVHDLPESFEAHFAAANVSQRRCDRAVYRGAALRLPVSEPMETELFKRYGARGTVFLPIAVSDRADAPVSRSVVDRPLTVGYAGSLGSRYDAVLRPLAAALDGSAIRLNVYSHSAPAWPVGKNTFYRGSFESKVLWTKVQAECDALLIAVGSANATDAAMNSTSFPSKLPEYLRLGLPVIMAAPEYSAVRQWAARHKDVFLLAPPEPAVICGQLSGLAGNRDLGARAGAAARRLYEREFHPTTVRERFRGLLAQATLAGSTLTAL